MRPEYDGVKFYSRDDMSIGWELEKAEPILASFDASKNYDDINVILELFNVQELLDTGIALPSWTEEIHNEYCDIGKQFNSIFGRFFGKIDDSSFAYVEREVSIGYIDDFWNLFVKFKVYTRISSGVMSNCLSQLDTTLYKLLKHKELVNYYDAEFSAVLRTSDQTAHILSSKFLEKGNDLCFLPKSFLPSEYEAIFLQYIQSDQANPNVLQLIYNAQSSSECPISDKLRLGAKRAYEKYWKEHSASTIMTEYGIEVSFQEQDELIVYDNRGSKYHISYDVKWLEETLDCPSILNNFRYVFEMFDYFGRSSLVSIKSRISAFENVLSVNGVKFYRRGNQFNMMNMLSSVQMELYYNFLLEHDIYLEEVFRWFFERYLPDEFGAMGFRMNISSPAASLVEKCRSLAAEMDGVLKQFRMFVSDGAINRELYEMSSEHMVFNGIPSLNKRKYAYSAREDVKNEMSALFSDQSILGFTDKTEDKYLTLFELLRNEEIYKTDFDYYQVPSIEWLSQKGSIQIEESGAVKLVIPRVSVLKDLYEHDVVCISAYSEWLPQMEEMISAGELKVESSLFSRSETDYLNYMLNKAQFSDGLDLRNKYLHSTYSINEDEQRHDYIQLLKLMVLVVTKINDDFCIWDGSKVVTS